ncbi:hypothetical protein GDI0376 [Gluconacetobacter diazotrophicus PA1 5]|uniref:Uncharacterized protein n=1 Tax=Gluconacetobacter diazotrophicus (strain ATCC 49037 / DSM 5601 / CCUG 37298 / CIP 103539 / LMG 7603 / PAl5) TaxID=272568 RepID=A9H5D7_GLUDA|nr:hypothetical protein GDI0376 [Gluconacetobacter diazotrophicus PA1 5]
MLPRKFDHLTQRLRLAAGITALAFLELSPVGLRLRVPVIRHVRRPSLHISGDRAWRTSCKEIRELCRENSDYCMRDASHRACSRFIASGAMGAVIMAR